MAAGKTGKGPRKGPERAAGGPFQGREEEIDTERAAGRAGQGRKGPGKEPPEWLGRAGKGPSGAKAPPEGPEKGRQKGCRLSERPDKAAGRAGKGLRTAGKSPATKPLEGPERGAGRAGKGRSDFTCQGKSECGGGKWRYVCKFAPR